jgi:predicted RND superfamily exporter protein
MQNELIEKSENLDLNNQMLQASLRTKDKLIGIISHDIRGPVVMINSGLNMLEDLDNLDNENKQIFNELKKRSNSTVSLINNLLIWSRSQTNQIKFSPILLQSEKIHSIFQSISEIDSNKNLSINLDVIESKLQEKIDELFPKERYEVSITGKAVVFQKGTKYLLDNLLQSLLLSVFITALLIAFMFRSIKMIIVALVPNLLPLLMTAGIMGYFNIPLKPSTILVFGIAFGLSVDDTIRFLAEYRQSLTRNNWKIKKSVFATINESGLSMFYTSVVLFSGFSVFMLSSFGGTIALGGLGSITLLFGMLSNLVLLPSLVLTLNKTLANQQEFLEPTINILSDEEVGEIDKIESNEFEEEDIEEEKSNDK